MSAWLEVVSLVVIGWVAGAEMRAWGFVRPCLRRLPYEPQVAMEQGMLAHFGPLLGFLLPLSVVLAAGLAYMSPIREGGPYWLRLAAALCVATTLVTTLVVNVPINARTAAWEATGDGEAWTRMRARWHAFQGVRAALFMAAFVLLAVAQALLHHPTTASGSGP